MMVPIRVQVKIKSRSIVLFAIVIYVPALFASIKLVLRQCDDGANTCPSENQASQE